MEPEETVTYKYLGMTINSKDSLEDHLSKVKGNVETAYQIILTIANNQQFHNIEMTIIWQLVT